MNRETFLGKLLEALPELSVSEKEDVRGYFDELIQDKAADNGISEEEVIASLGTLKAVASEVRTSAMQSRPNQPQQKPPTPEHRGGAGGIKVVTASAEQVRDILIRVYNQHITVQPGPSDQVELRYEENDVVTYDFSLDGGEMRLIQPMPAPWTLNGLRFLFSQAPSITLTLPRDFAGQLDAQTSNAAIDMTGVELWGSLRLKSANGAVTLERCAAREMDVQTSNSRVTAGQLRAKKDITLRTSNGAVQCDQASCSGTLTLRTSNGRLSFSGLDAAGLSLTTSNSGISGSVKHPPEEYAVVSSTSNGKNNLRGHSFQGPRPLSARTSNGSIRIDFEP